MDPMLPALSFEMLACQGKATRVLVLNDGVGVGIAQWPIRAGFQSRQPEQKLCLLVLIIRRSRAGILPAQCSRTRIAIGSCLVRTSGLLAASVLWPQLLYITNGGDGVNGDAALQDPVTEA